MKKPLAILILALVAIPLLIASTFLLSLRGKATERDFWVAALTDDRLLDGIASLSALEGPGAERRVMIEGVAFDAPSLARAALAALPRKEYAQAAASLVDDMFGAKGASAQDAQEAFLSALSAQAPVFASAYLDSLPEAEGMPGPDDLSFRPKGLSSAELRRLAAPALEAAWREAAVGTVRDGMEDIQKARSAAGIPARPRSTLSASLSLSLFLGLCALIGSAFLYGGPWSERLVLMGVGVLLASLPALILGVAMRAGANAQGLVELIARSGGPAIPPAALSSAAGLLAWAKDILGGLSSSFLAIGIGGISLGALLISLRWPFAAREA